MKESDVQAAIKNYVAARGGYIKKFHANRYSGSGKSDVWLCYKGWFIVFEVKKLDTQGNMTRTTKEQDIHIKQVQEAGGIGRAVASVREVADVLDYIDAVESTFKRQIASRIST